MGCRSLERQGYRVVRAHPEGAAGGRSPACLAPLRYPPPTERRDAFLRFVEETCRASPPDAVLPLDEDIVRLLAEARLDLAGAALAGPDAGQYAALCDKGRLAEAARLAGVDHPRTVEAATVASTRDLPPAPCIVKPRISGSSGLWEKPLLAATDAERDQAVGACSTPGPAPWSGAARRAPLGGPLRAGRREVRLPRLPRRARLPPPRRARPR